MRGKTILVVVLALTVVLAGCTGGDGNGPTATDVDNGGNGGSNGGGDGGDGAGDTWRLFGFDQTGKYTYDVYMEGEGTGTLVWDVQQVSGDRVTTHVVYDVGDVQYESTVTGTADVAQSQLMTTPAGALLATTLFTPGLWYGGRELAVGNGWSYQTGEGSGSFEITETRTMAGIQCYATEMKIDGTLRHEGCFSPDHGLAPYSAWYDEDGTLVMELELRNYGPSEGPSTDGGDGDGGDGTATPTAEEPTPTPEEPTEEPPQYWDAFAFDRPATYTYDVFVEGEGTGTLVWDVQQVSGNQVTVRLDYRVGDVSYQSTVTGTPETVRQQTMMTPAGGLLVLTLYTPMGWYGSYDLAVGNEWSLTTEDGTAEFRVTGTGSYAGLQCYATEMKIDGTTQHEACLSPELGLAPYSAWYDEDGTLVMEIELVSYEEN